MTQILADLDGAKKKIYVATLAPQESKLSEFTADLQSESGRKYCVRIAKQREEMPSLCAI